MTRLRLHKWDAYTITHEPILSIDLMERASLLCSEHIQAEHDHNQIHHCLWHG